MKILRMGGGNLAEILVLSEEFDQISTRLLPNDFGCWLHIIAIVEYLEKTTQFCIFASGHKSYARQLVGNRHIHA